jgi:hypothetical protein
MLGVTTRHAHMKTGGSMNLAAGALAFSSAIDLAIASIALPPHRSTRPERRSKGDKGAARNPFASFRRELAHTAEDPATGWLPRLALYRY